MPQNIKWSNEKIVKVLGNAMAYRLVNDGEESPVAEKVLLKLMKGGK